MVKYLWKDAIIPRFQNYIKFTTFYPVKYIRSTKTPNISKRCSRFTPLWFQKYKIYIYLLNYFLQTFKKQIKMIGYFWCYTRSHHFIHEFWCKEAMPWIIFQLSKLVGLVPVLCIQKNQLHRGLACGDLACNEIQEKMYGEQNKTSRMFKTS